jgi:hypothetical protein
MLVKYVTCNRDEIGLGASDGFVMLHSHQAQKHLLRKVGRVGSIAQPLRKKAQQPPAVTAGDLGNEDGPSLFLQMASRGVVSDKPLTRGTKSALELKVDTVHPDLFFVLAGQALSMSYFASISESVAFLQQHVWCTGRPFKIKYLSNTSANFQVTPVFWPFRFRRLAPRHRPLRRKKKRRAPNRKPSPFF